MPLPSPDASSTRTLLPEETQVDQYDRREIVRDTTVTKTAFIKRDYTQAANMISAYVEGHTLRCTYYSLLASKGLQRSSPTDTTSRRDNLTLPLLKISQFEMKTQEDFSPSYDSERTETVVTSSAVTYPEFKPHIGDLFIYELSNGQVGLFQISDVEPLSYFTQMLHRVSFFLTDILDEDRRLQLEDRVRRHVVFSKDPTSVSSRSLLEADSHANLLRLERMRKTIITSFVETFYLHSLSSFERADGVYDPYVVRFLSALVGYDDHPLIPSQLYPDVDRTFHRTIFSRLLDRDRTSLDGLVSTVRTVRETAGYHDVRVTSLVNRQFVLSDDDGDETYVLSDAFYAQDEDAMTDLECHLFKVITTRSVTDIAGLMTHLERHADDGLTPQVFYRQPLLVFLAGQAIRSLRYLS